MSFILPYQIDSDQTSLLILDMIRFHAEHFCNYYYFLILLNLVVKLCVFPLFLYRKHALNCHRMKPALFNILCDIKEKTGKVKFTTLKQ